MGTPFRITWIEPEARQMLIETDEITYDGSWVAFTNTGDKIPMAILNKDQIRLIQVDDGSGNLLGAFEPIFGEPGQP